MNSDLPNKWAAVLLACGCGVFSASNVFAATHYVDLNSPDPTPPYTNWATASTVIQDAVDVASAGDELVVTNGIYAAGGWGSGLGGDGSNRVAVLKALAIRSVHGPGVTAIDGAGAMRCIYLTSGASVSGFTLTNGFVSKRAGGGVYCEGPTAVVSNCVIVSNSVYGFSYDLSMDSGAGGGAFGGTLNNCALIGNSVHGYIYIGLSIYYAAGLGGGAANCSLSNCVLIGNSAYAAGDHADAPGEGGGAADCSLNNCMLIDNYADDAGGGAYSGGFYVGFGKMLNNCVLIGNSAEWGGGACGATLGNCVMASNSASTGGGAVDSELNNCILYFNNSGGGANYVSSRPINYCCTTPLPTNGFGNITNAPFFVNLAAGDIRLQSNSPCINAGNNDYVTTTIDLDGNPRIAGGTVDIGAYENQNPGSVISYAWLQQYGLPTDGSADFTDPDGDRMNNWQEWRCQTVPTDPLSALRMLSPVVTPTNATVSWQSAAGVSYFVERGTNLKISPAFMRLATNIVGQPGTTTYTDTNALGSGPLFYRIGVGN